jgi:hypothetical protein
MVVTANVEAFVDWEREKVVGWCTQEESVASSRSVG